ncbi:MAG TPA: class I SAM-dependent methyltransferase [Chromatiaceae bacterium]|nr:class I SAM-dependent methyltransferase [Chromatiaceae bacterium]HIB84085.1 class I SAM-dependent methyltransferase [Chromatiaceae bacterium]HIN82807.1 class I SAM-dependent methyltransferase [Chromatiales bacterium]HIO13769.1 class I SAM-dependent methyltransferase [Chromatiales bacterium]HIO55304.1 class I SAM-dependent methyltransferase [Chromatiales bacterium]
MTMAKKADRHILYQNSVQCVEAEIDFVDETFEALRERKANLIREDFCGTANTSCEWIRRRDTNRAFGVDLCGDTLQWGRDHNIAALPSASRTRLSLIQDNVLTVATDPVDALLAMNFSYWCFKDRDTLRNYFVHARESLVDDGIMFLDAFGGYEAFCLMEEPRQCEGFTYVWDQADYNPINGDATCKIHFKFRDGSSLMDAFVYEWRLWTLPEIQELLLEAGFAHVTVFWDSTEDGDGVYLPETVGEPDAGWLCYIVAEK